jgi:hypothetical protein
MPAPATAATSTLEPLVPQQELSRVLGGVSYWEGVCRVRDEEAEDVGSACLELTGCAGSLTERFR